MHKEMSFYPLDDENPQINKKTKNPENLKIDREDPNSEVFSWGCDRFG